MASVSYILVGGPKRKHDFGANVKEHEKVKGSQ